MPVELLGGVRFPQIGELPYLLTLGGYGFYWIRLPRSAETADEPTQRRCRRRMSEHPADDAPTSREARWFAGKGLDYDVVDVDRVGTLPGPPVVTIDILTVQYAAEAGRRGAGRPSATRCRCRTTPRSRTASGTPTSGRTPTTSSASCTPTTRCTTARRWPSTSTPSRRPRGNSSMPYGGLTFHRLDRARARHRRRTRRCSAASRATPRWPSATTACSRCSAR